VCPGDAVKWLHGGDPRGETILPLVVAIKQWSEAHISEIHTARDTYDERTGD
jgi:DNA-binding HxlR family transcriptional regulator